MRRLTTALQNRVARFALVCVAVSASSLIATAGWSQTLTWLGTLGGNWSEGWDVTDSGVVTGWSRNVDGVWRAFRWTPLTGMEDLGRLGDDRFAQGISANGQVVVGVYYAPGQMRAFRWSAVTGMQDIGTPGGAASGAWDISADGTVIVCSGSNAAGFWRACRWTQSTGMRELGTLGGNESASWDISADGTVIVGWAQNSAGQARAFRWTQSSGMQDLGTLGGAWSEARRVSANGAVVVGWSPDAAGQIRAFRWVAGVGMRSLGTLGGNESRAYGVSGDGSIVVGGSFTASGAWNAFRWTRNGIENLNTTYSALLVNGSVLNGAHAVSPNGRYIVGYGYNLATGRHEAFLLDTQCSVSGDVNNDRIVDDEDLLILLFNFGTACRN